MQHVPQDACCWLAIHVRSNPGKLKGHLLYQDKAHSAVKFTVQLQDLDYRCAYAAQATNRRTLGAMVRELSKGGKLVWIAPSGGRDRPEADTGAWLPHKYDAGKLCSLHT